MASDAAAAGGAGVRAVERVPLGKQGLMMPRIGAGVMGFTWGYASTTIGDPAMVFPKAEAVFDELQKRGCNALVTAWIYATPGFPHNEEVVGAALKKHGRDKWIVVDKIGQDFSRKPPTVQSPEQLREQLEQSLARLGTDYIDLLVLNRPDPSIPIEDIMATFKAFVAEGKVKYVGLSEATPEEVRRAHAVCPLSCVEQEYSLTTRDIEGDLLPTLRELGVGVLAYSPLGRGLLGSEIKTRADLKPGDWRLTAPRFSEENIAKNAAKVEKLAAIASRKGVSTAQLALAWLCAQGDDIVPIPGTTRAERVAENVEGSLLKLTAEEVAEITANVPEAEGARYPSYVATFNNRPGAAPAAAPAPAAAAPAEGK